MVASGARDICNFEQFSECLKERVSGVQIENTDPRDLNLENDVKTVLTVNGKFNFELFFFILLDFSSHHSFPF